MTSDARKRQAGESKVVTIDPTDAAQVRRLDDLIQKHLDDPSAPKYLSTADLLSMALSDYATPPKPDEPTGLGAVVEAICDNHFVRVSLEGETPWRRVSKAEWPDCAWGEIAVVRVLSDGVQP